jgi:outer membrane protein TolC
MMTRWTVAAIAAGVLIAASITPGAEPKGESPADVKAQIKALQKERVEALTRLVEVYTVQYKMGTGTFEALVGAQDDLVNAQLDSTEKPEERVALLTGHLKTATDAAKIAQGMVEAGAASQAIIYRARSHLLDIKIKLLRERSRLPAK